MQQLFWNTYALAYDSLRFVRPYHALHERVAGHLRHLDPKPVAILDAGCGTGSLLRRLREDHPASALYGVDWSDSMLNVARRKLAGCRIAFSKQDLNGELSFDDQTFDCVVSVNALYALKNPAAALTEFHRLLKPGGHLLLVNGICSDQSVVWRAHFEDLWDSGGPRDYAETLFHMPELFFIAAINTFIARRVRDRVFHFLPPNELVKLVALADFEPLLLEESVYAGLSCLVLCRRGT